jgi:hypothetical protein
VGEDVETEASDIVEDNTSLFHRRDDGGEVVVGQDHPGGFAGDVGSDDTHGDSDVGLAQGRCIVHAITGHRHYLSFAAQNPRDVHLVLRGDPREDHARATQILPKLGVGCLRDVAASDDERLVWIDQSDTNGNSLRGEAVVAGDHHHPNASTAAQIDRRRDFRARGIHHGE